MKEVVRRMVVVVVVLADEMIWRVTVAGMAWRMKAY